jgi:hypothetical protein
MSSFALDSTGDLDLSTGKILLLEGAASIAQKLSCRIKFLLGEWFLDARLGIPWIQELLEKGVAESYIRSKIQRTIATCPGVTTLESLEIAIDAATREAEISFSAIADNGETIDFSEAFVLP